MNRSGTTVNGASEFSLAYQKADGFPPILMFRFNRHLPSSSRKDRGVVISFSPLLFSRFLLLEVATQVSRLRFFFRQYLN